MRELNRTTLLAICLSLAACAAGGSGSGGNSVSDSDAEDAQLIADYLLVSDGTLGGDLIETQMRNELSFCSSSTDGNGPHCWGGGWPPGYAECLRDGLNRNIVANEDLIRCAIDSYNEMTVCLDDPWVIPGRCRIAMQEALRECPPADEELRIAVDGCDQGYSSFPDWVDSGT